jgi:hypothetical protein
MLPGVCDSVSPKTIRIEDDHESRCLMDDPETSSLFLQKESADA